MSKIERDLQPVNPEEDLSEVKEVRFETPEGTKIFIRPIREEDLHLTPEFKDFAELTRARDPITYGEVALVQAIRRRPRLQKKIESLVRRLGKEIDLSKRRT